MTTELETPSADTHRNWIENADVRKLQIGCWIGFIAIALVRAWFTRYELMGGDSISYLDIARAFAAGHLGAVTNPYWSPGYPALISLFFWAFHPNAYWEFPLVHLVHVLIFIGTLASFQLFWSETLQWHRKFARVRGAAIPESAFWALGYAAFGIAILSVIKVSLVGADLLLSAFCCLAGWCTLCLRRDMSLSLCVLLGAVLALAYYAKAPFFPMGIVFIICACSWRPVSRRTILLAGTAFITFLLGCAPLITALSLAKGRLTFGDTARFNWAVFIDGVQYLHWQGGPPGSGTPVHPTHKLNDFPEIYEFAADNMGTYPEWFDPTYWDEGITPHLNLKRQMIVLVLNLALEFQFILESGAELVCILIVLVLICGHRNQWAEGLWQLWFIWVPGATAMAMFALVHVEARFVGGWLLLLFAGAVCACSLPTDIGSRLTVSCAGAAALITVGAALILQATTEATGANHAAAGRSPRDVSIAVFLLGNGLHPGDPIAFIGDGSEAYWAHLARLHLIAEIPASIPRLPVHPAMDFWESGPELQQEALAILERTGARAVIAGAMQHSVESSLRGGVPLVVPPPWKKIDGTGAYVYFFPARP